MLHRAAAAPDRSRGHRGEDAHGRRLDGDRSRWQRVAAGYEKWRRDGALPASYEVVYGHAWKVAPRKTADGRQVVDFQRGTT